MVVVTHEVRFARHVSDTVVMVHEGRIVEEAPPEEFFDDPKSDATRQFLKHVI